MTGRRKTTLLVIGFLATLLIISQLVMGLLILNDPANPKIRKAHQHSGYLTATVALLYFGFSMATIASVPARSSRD